MSSGEQAPKRAFHATRSMDTIGFSLVALTFGTLEFVLDKGQEDDWFSSQVIVAFTIIAAIGLVALIAWELSLSRREQRPILDLRLFRQRNCSVAFLMTFVMGFTRYATTVLLPQLLQSEVAGMAMSSGGLATIICVPIVGF
jgi:DHA2 family multidrug resistance protein